MANWRVKERGQIALHHRKLPYLPQPLISLSQPVFSLMADRLVRTTGCIFYHLFGTEADAENREASGTRWCSSRALHHLVSAEILACICLPRGFASSRMTLAEMRGVISSDYPLITRPKASQWNATNHQLLCGSPTRNWRGAMVNSQEAQHAHKLPIISEPQLSLTISSHSFRIIWNMEDPLWLGIFCQKKIGN